MEPPQGEDVQQMVADRSEVRVKLSQGGGDVFTGCLATHLVNHHVRNILGRVEDEIDVLEIMAPVCQQVPIPVWVHAEGSTSGLARHDLGKGVLLQFFDGDYSPCDCCVGSDGGSCCSENEVHYNGNQLTGNYGKPSRSWHEQIPRAPVTKVQIHPGGVEKASSPLGHSPETQQ